MKRIRALYNLELYDNNGVIRQIGSETYIEAEKISKYEDGYCDILLKDGTSLLGVVYSDFENHGVPEDNIRNIQINEQE